MNRRTFMKSMLGAALVVASGVDLLLPPPVDPKKYKHSKYSKGWVIRQEYLLDANDWYLIPEKGEGQTVPYDHRIVGFWDMRFDESQS